jgi:ActD protein
MSATPTYALLAEFAEPAALLAAARASRARYRDVDAYTPYSVEGLPEALGFTHDRVALIALIGGIAGGLAAYFLQWYTAVLDYPINAGGRPLHSWPAFIPATFEVTVLAAALALFVGMWALNGLPRLRHPVFNASQFDLASRNRFFLAIRASDPAFDVERTRGFLEQLHPLRVIEVPDEA